MKKRRVIGISLLILSISLLVPLSYLDEYVQTTTFLTHFLRAMFYFLTVALGELGMFLFGIYLITEEK